MKHRLVTIVLNEAEGSATQFNLSHMTASAADRQYSALTVCGRLFGGCFPFQQTILPMGDGGLATSCFP